MMKWVSSEKTPLALVCTIYSVPLYWFTMRRFDWNTGTNKPQRCELTGSYVCVCVCVCCVVVVHGSLGNEHKLKLCTALHSTDSEPLHSRCDIWKVEQSCSFTEYIFTCHSRKASQINVDKFHYSVSWLPETQQSFLMSPCAFQGDKSSLLRITWIKQWWKYYSDHLLGYKYQCNSV